MSLRFTFSSAAKLAEKFDDYEGPSEGYLIKAEGDGECGPGDEVMVEKSNRQQKPAKLGRFVYRTRFGELLFEIDADGGPKLRASDLPED